MINNADLKELTVKELLDGNDRYIIPIYQRNYAWEEKEIEQLLQDIIDYIPKDKIQAINNYYIGTLIINENTENNTILYETIDGQQRITTLSILTSVIKHKLKDTNLALDWYKNINLEFYSRSQSTDTLEAVFQDYFSNNHIYNDGIKNGYDLIHKHLDKKLNEAKITLETFSNFLFSKVKIIRVQVPLNTDLNHYFEIMNTRGEQLEKHEVLKATLLSIYNEIDNEDEKKKHFAVFNLIWEAVSDMDYYMQYRFNPDLRDGLFGKEWNRIQMKNHNELFLFLDKKLAINNDKKISIEEIILSESNFEKPKDTVEESDRFHTVINFPNFLLHVLRIQLKSKEVVLDDKKLLTIFKDEIKKSDNKLVFVNNFIYHLFKTRFLFDKYVIKREYTSNKESWSLKTLKHYKDSQANFVNSFGTEEDLDNETVLMVLAMFHVSTPTMIYKHWLNSVLFHLNENYCFENEIDLDSYIIYLETFAKDLLLHRFLNIEPIDYFDLIYNKNQLKLVDRKIKYDESKLSYGLIENNLVFNFLDYILWKKDYVEGIDFEFTFRSSVEHFYPQNPIGGIPLNDKSVLHSFGNLCLISHSKNSKLNNHLPSAKKNYYSKIETDDKTDSFKQYVMMFNYDVTNWDEESINDHKVKMIDEFNEFIDTL